jgi:hypothetical protein
MLEADGDQSNGHYRAKVHDPSEYINATDMPLRLMELVERDVPVLVSSGIFDHDIEATLERRRGGPLRERHAPRPGS